MLALSLEQFTSTTYLLRQALELKTPILSLVPLLCTRRSKFTVTIVIDNELLSPICELTLNYPGDISTREVSEGPPYYLVEKVETLFVDPVGLIGFLHAAKVSAKQE